MLYRKREKETKVQRFISKKWKAFSTPIPITILSGAMFGPS